jgi:hypothetical protein
VKLPDQPVRLVVASQFVRDQAVVVALTRTFNPLEWAPQEDTISGAFREQVLVRDALVTLSYGNQTDTLEMTAPGVYTSINVQLSENIPYTLNAFDPLTGQSVTATADMLPRVRFEKAEPDIVYSDDEDPIVEIYYTFRDDPAVKNWYLVNFYRKVTLDPNILTPDTLITGASNRSLAFELISDDNLSDPLFSGTRRLREVSLTDTIAVSVANVSQGYYEFLNLYGRSGNVITRISGDPIVYPTNVQNGYGYFTTHAPDIRVFDLNEYD